MAALQHRSNAFISKTAKTPVAIEYKSAENKQAVAPRFIFECAIKLNMKPLTCATAAVIYHRFYREVVQAEYDEYLIASSSLYLAGKIKDDPIKIRDIINVAHNTLNRGTGPLELGDEYWAMRDGIVQAELLITRMLKFDMNVEHPHKYMLHYMLSLKEWFGPNVWNSMPVAKTAASFLHDFHASPYILDYSPSDIAICCLLLTFQIYGVQVPLTDDFDENSVWYRVFSKNLTKEMAWQIIEKIMDVYNNDTQSGIWEVYNVHFVYHLIDLVALLYFKNNCLGCITVAHFELHFLFVVIADQLRYTSDLGLFLFTIFSLQLKFVSFFSLYRVNEFLTEFVFYIQKCISTASASMSTGQFFIVTAKFYGK